MKRIRKQLSIVDKDLNIEGTLQFKGDILVAGTLRGDLLGERALTAKGSHVYADVKVDEISIGGNFEGNIIAHKRLRILNTGNVTGTLSCNTLIIDAGGILNGKVKLLTTKNAVSSSETKKVTSAL